MTATLTLAKDATAEYIVGDTIFTNFPGITSASLDRVTVLIELVERIPLLGIISQPLRVTPCSTSSVMAVSISSIPTSMLSSSSSFTSSSSVALCSSALLVL
uniref:Uncharacterized protein n=1 Tax=Glossina pallidipes TaxID=7398 RepID=A0A1B0AIQ5_GLOPL